jgi:hypothetical protein
MRRKPKFAKSQSEHRAEVFADAQRYTSALALIRCEEDARAGRYLLRPRNRWLWGYLWVEVVTVVGGVLVHGDCDTVLFSGFGSDGDRGPRAKLYWQARNNPGYGAEKAHHGDTAPDEWHPEVAAADLLFHLRHKSFTCADPEEREELRSVWQGLRRGDLDQSEFAERIHDLTGDSELCAMGTVPARAVTVAQCVLMRLVAELEARDFREAASKWLRREAA